MTQNPNIEQANIEQINNLPSLFISHGAPDILLTKGESRDSFQQVASSIAKPKAIIIISAHWVSNVVGITDMDELDTIHDFGGFQPELYKMRYPALGDHALAQRVASLLQEKDFATKLHQTRGLDHGAWMPLSLMYPDADIPVVQVSLPQSSLERLVDFGKALQPLREEGVLIIGSGGSVHNLGELKFNGGPDSWALEFDDWLKESIENNHSENLISETKLPNNFRRAHPTLEHYAPLIVSWAAGNWSEAGKRLHQSFNYGNAAISHFLFGSDLNSTNTHQFNEKHHES